MIEKFIIYSIAALFLWLSPLDVRAQLDSAEYNYYLNDDGISASRNVIKTDLIRLIHGELSFLYERVVSDQVSLEAGLGLHLPYYVHDFFPLLVGSDADFSDRKNGHSLQFQARWYPEGMSPELNYWSLLYKKRKFSSLTFTEMSVNMGKQKILGDRFMVDYAFGMGIRYVPAGQIYDDSDLDFTIIIPLMVRLGYLY